MRHHVRRVRKFASWLLGVLTAETFHSLLLDAKRVRDVCIIMCINCRPLNTMMNTISHTKSREDYVSSCAANRLSSSVVCLLLALVVGTFGGGYAAGASSNDLLLPFARELAAAAMANPSLRVSNV